MIGGTLHLVGASNVNNNIGTTIADVSITPEVSIPPFTPPPAPTDDFSFTPLLYKPFVSVREERIPTHLQNDVFAIPLPWRSAVSNLMSWFVDNPEHKLALKTFARGLEEGVKDEQYTSSKKRPCPLESDLDQVPAKVPRTTVRPPTGKAPNPKVKVVSLVSDLSEGSVTDPEGEEDDGIEDEEDDHTTLGEDEEMKEAEGGEESDGGESDGTEEAVVDVLGEGISLGGTVEEATTEEYEDGGTEGGQEIEGIDGHEGTQEEGEEVVEVCRKRRGRKRCGKSLEGGKCPRH